MRDLLAILLSAQAIHHRISNFETSARQQAAECGPLPSAKHHAGLLKDLAAQRRKLTRMIGGLAGKDARRLSGIKDIHTASGRLRGIMFGQGLRKDEAEFLARQDRIFRKNWAQPGCFKAFTIVSFYAQPFDVTLQKNIGKLSTAELRCYLHFALRQPHIMQAEDEKKYVDYYRHLTDWLLHLVKISERWPPARAQILRQVIKSALTFGTCYYIDLPIGDLVKARAQIVTALTRRLPGFKQLKTFPQPAKPAPGRHKLRFGIISRNIGDYTDTRALYALFREFDPERYEIYWYSLDIIDPTTLSDVEFFRKLYAFTHKVVSLRGDGAQKAQQVLNDDLDFLAVGTAYSFGAQYLDQMLSKRLARIQVGLNAMVPSSSGFASYDYSIVPEASAEALKNFYAESSETLKFVADPMIWYEPRPVTQPDKFVTRTALGIPKNAIIYCSGAVANKQMPGTLTCWLEILRQVPNSYLLLYPYNPAWGGYFIGLTFLARLNALLKQYPDIDPARIVVTRQVTPDEGNRLILLSDIYLGSFPHAGATSATLALQHGKPVVARHARWLRSTTDPSLVRSIGLPELIGKDNEEVTAIAVRLGLDRAWREKITAHIASALPSAPFFDSVNGSRRFQALFDDMAAEKGLLERSSIKPQLRVVR